MFLERLQVIHHSKRSIKSPINGSALSLDTELPGVFSLDTCQRRIWVGPIEVFGNAFKETFKEIEQQGFEKFNGQAAYAFLLRVATGLESEIKGETDIFGQLKMAWAKFEEQRRWPIQDYESLTDLLVQQTRANELSLWMRKLFEDTKEIRAHYLQNTGGDAYGSLVRKLVKSIPSPKREPILLVGAGSLAQSVAPWLLEHELWICNRTIASAKRLTEELSLKPGARVKWIDSSEAELLAWQNAAHVVVCIPIDLDGDPARLESWKKGYQTGKSIVHLGTLRKDSGPWQNIDSLYTLDDIFELQKQQEEARSEFFTRALRAIEEKATLRSLSGSLAGSITLPHGWEDLAVFA